MTIQMETFLSDSNKPPMKPWEMILAHRYEDAVAVYKRELQRAPDDRIRWAEYADALLCLGRFEDALKGYSRANDLQHPALKADDPAPYQNSIGAVQWLMGDRKAAIDTFREAVDGILDGTTKFGDLAGGVSQGLLLWYAGVTAKDSTARSHALKYLSKLSQKPRAKYWPGPLTGYAVGKVKFEAALKVATDTSDVDEAVAKAETDLLKHRQLCQALFYRAVKRRETGDEKGCLKGMRECLNLKNPVLELEWYLARGEVEGKSVSKK